MGFVMCDCFDNFVDDLVMFVIEFIVFCIALFMYIYYYYYYLFCLYWC